jgi:hypothetical protein
MIRPSLGFGTTAFSLTEIKSPPAGGRFDLLLNLGQVEGACRLARRIILHGSEELSRQLLDGDENEHSLQEPIVVGVRGANVCFRAQTFGGSLFRLGDLCGGHVATNYRARLPCRWNSACNRLRSIQTLPKKGLLTQLAVSTI